MDKLNEILIKLRTYRFIEPDKHFAFYDTECMTAIEQTAHLRGLLKSVVAEVNEFVADITSVLEQYTEFTSSDLCCFKKHIEDATADYMKLLDEKIKNQDITINNAVEYFRYNILEAVETKVSEMITEGAFDETLTELLSALNENVTAMKETVLTLTDTVIPAIQLKTETMENSIESINESIAQQDKNIGANRQYIDSRYEELDEYINNSHSQLLNEINSNVTTLDSNKVNVKSFKSITGTIVTPAADDETITGTVELEYPDGFTKDNCFVVGLMGQNTGDGKANWCTHQYPGASAHLTGSSNLFAKLEADCVTIGVTKPDTSAASKTYTVKCLLYKYL